MEHIGLMRTRVWEVISGLTRSAGTFVTLLVLVAIGYVGHHTEWSFSFEHGHEKKHETVDHAPQAANDNPLRVHFRSAQAIRKSGISTVKAEQRTMSEDLLANGVVDYNQKLVARLSSRVAGTVWRVEKYWGDAIQAGDVLAIIEAAEIGRMKAEFLTALAATKTHTETLNALEALSGGAIPERQIRQARLTLLESRIRLLNAEQALVNVGLNLRMEDFQQQPDTKQVEMLHFIGLPPDLATSLDPDKTTSNLVPLVAPFDGVVVDHDMGLGEVVEPTRSLFQIADVRKMWINLQVQREDAPKIEIGQEIFFRGDGIAKELQSKISWIGTEVNAATRTLQVRAEVDNPITHPGSPSVTGQRLLRANIFGTGRIRLRTAENALIVPNECIQSDEQSFLVFVKTDEETFEGRRVTCGIKSATHTQIEGPVSVEDEIASRGSHILKSQVLLSKLDSESP